MSSHASGTPFRGSRLVTWYAVFAAVSILANLGSQKLAFWSYQGTLAVPASVCAGTAVGLVVKYLLDKAWIFRYPHRSVAHGVRTFALYVAMGLGTTLIFWSVEFGADALFHSEPARLLGGALGLTAGYVAKYYLDRRFVFCVTGGAVWRTQNCGIRRYHLLQQGGNSEAKPLCVSRAARGFWWGGGKMTAATVPLCVDLDGTLTRTDFFA